MRVLVVGSGAREHALCARLGSSPLVTEVLCAPGNAGIAAVARCEPTDTTQVAAVVELARSESVGLVVVGPEAPLVAGLADQLAAAGIPCFGPGAAAAEIEGSKAFAKAFMQRHGIPTAAHATFTDIDAAIAHVRSRRSAVVVKASGLAAGKGVFVCDGPHDAIEAVKAMLEDGSLGEAGTTVVIEERLVGEEVSFHVVCDGARYVVLGAAQDHKRLGEGDTGPNTGGMGAYAPVPVLTASLQARVCASIVEPTLAGLAREGRAFRGALFVGLMVHGGVPCVLEYNARLGDPECAVLLARSTGDLMPLLLGAARGDLREAPVPQTTGAAVAVVIAAAGYPGSTRHGDVIGGLEAAGAVPGVHVLHGGTRRAGDRIVTSGGRALLVTGVGADVDHAAARAYAAADQIALAGAQMRRDIGWRARTGRGA